MLRAACRLILLTVLLAPALAAAQSAFPNHPVKIIVPFPAGGSNDIQARIIGEKLSAKWGQPIVVENRTGAQGNIGAAVAAQAEPDGYTLMLAPAGPFAINGALYQHLTYDPDKFVPIALIGSIPNLIIARKELPPDNVKDLIAYLKANDGKVIYGSQGVGATPHLTANMFMSMTGTHMVHVPYRGETLVLQDMLGGRVDLFFGNVSAALALYRAGKVKVLAVTDAKRAPQMPQVPTTAEAGLPDLVAVGWFAMAGPAGMKPELAAQISAAVNEALAMPDVQKRFHDLAVDPMGGTPAHMADFIKDEKVRWGNVIKQNHIVLE